MAASDTDIPKPDPSDAKYVEKLLSLCKVSEITDRHEDMCAYLKLLLAAKKGDLTDDERNLFSVGFKSVIGGLRRSWRALVSEQEEDDSVLKNYKDFIKNQIDAVCDDVVEQITKVILPTEEGKPAETDAQKQLNAEAQTFYHKMVGDYQRYKAELRPDDPSKGDAATDAYKKAMEIAGPLSDTDSTKLGLALNYSVCLYEIAKKPSEAVDVAKLAFDNALKKLDELDDNSYKNSTLIMQLLRDNLTLWTSEQSTEQEIEED